MANRTVKDAKSIRGTNPQYLIEKIIRSRIYDCKYWKEECFALTSELLVDKAMELRYLGGVYGGHVKPAPFLCLLLKMLQIQPEKEIVVEFIKNEEFKYVRALGAFYMRLTGTSIDCYKYLEPLYNDNRKLRRQNREAHFELVHVDEYIDELLREERLCDIILPRIQKRFVLEENNEIEPKVSALEDDLDEDIVSDDDIKETNDWKENHKPKTNDKPEKNRERDRDRRHRSREKERDKKDRKEDKDRKRERSRSRERRDKERERGDKERERGDKERERGDKERERGDKEREKEREKRRERERERERERDRERDRDRHYRNTTDRHDLDQRRRQRDKRH